MMYLTCWLKIKAWCYVRMKVTFLLRYFWRWFAIEICILVMNHIHVDKCEKVWMGNNILIIQEMYLTGLEYIFVRNTWNTCISDEDTFETGQTHPVYCQDICSHSYLFYIGHNEYYSTNAYLTSTSGLLCRSTTWELKFCRHIAADNVCRTAFRYGRKVADWKGYAK